jgi:Leucine-rich repeat (LRR) protein
MVEKELKTVFRYLRNYPHLKYIDINTNTIRDINILENIPYLLTLTAHTNKIEDISFLAKDNKLTYL